MADLMIDLSQLGTLHDSLNAIAGQFAVADQFSSDVSVAVGTIGNLQYETLSFATNWDDTRRHLNEKLTTLASAVETIRQTFEDLDDQLTLQAEALTEGWTLQATEAPN